MCRDLLLLGAGIAIGGAVGLAAGLWICCRKKAIKATKVVFVDEKGEEVMDVILELGGAAKRFRAVPKDDAGAVDPTVESFQHGYDAYDSGVTTATDGSSSITVEGEFVQITPLALSVDGLASAVVSGVDREAGEGEFFVTGTLNVTVVAAEADATHIEHEEVPAV